ncbi:ATP-dependent DNA helicase, partial [Suhomyces tanzawaensis NRRL Y-17324]
MINSNNLLSQLTWLRQHSPHVPDPSIVELALRKFPKKDIPTGFRGSTQISQIIPNKSKDTRINSNGVQSSHNGAQKIPVSTVIPSKARTGISANSSGSNGTSAGNPRNTNSAIPSPEPTKLLESLIALQDTKIRLFEERFEVSESTSLSLDAKQNFYRSEFNPKLETVNMEISGIRKELEAKRKSELQPIHSAPAPIIKTVDEDIHTYEFSDSDDDILAAAVSKLNDHFGDRTMDGLRTPTQERNDEDDLGSFIDDNEIVTDGESTYRSAQSDYESDHGGNVLDEIRLSPDVAENYGIKYNDPLESEVECIDEEVSTQMDSIKVEQRSEEVDEDPDEEAENDDDIEEIEDFTTQLNEERELNHEDIIELISDDEESYFSKPPIKKIELIPKPEPGPISQMIENVVESDDFSDEDDPELMKILNSHQRELLPMSNKENIPPGSEGFIDEVYTVLNSVFKLRSFRPNQLQAVCASLQSKDVFVLMPTGGGKSLCYQLPALIQGGKTKGTTVVISPLISLMQDQVQHLLNLNVKAGMISSKASSDDNKQTLNLFRDGFLQIVYLSPEKANNSAMVQRIIGKLYENNQLARVVIDEAHCLSSWGHDFRPDYQGMSFFKEKYPRVPLMALTATANEKVRMDIIHHLKMSSPVLLKQSFNRSNLFYEIKWKTPNYVEWIKDFVVSKHNGKTGIIYCHSKQSCEQTSAKLSLYGLKTSFYHAGMSPQDRFTVQSMWQSGKLQLICATIAFGMGIDKPDVRFVIHLFIPRSLEGYYQETGRAGRDGKHSECIMFYSYKDARQLQNMIHRDEELTVEGKENHLAKLRQVVQYCENTTDCRRKQVLHYFNESFNPIECRKECDNCLNSSNITTVEKNCTEYAKDIINLVQSIQEDQVTVLHCQDVFKGSNSSKIVKLGHNHSPFHGKGKSLDKTDVERIFFYLLSEDCLMEYQIMKGGFASNYVRVGKYANQVLNGQKVIKISFSNNNAKTTKPATTTYQSNVSLRTSAVESFSGMGLNGFRYQDSFVTARQMSNGDYNSAHIEYAHSELSKIRIEVLSETSTPLQQVVSDTALTDMAIKLPTNKKDFAKLTGITKEQLESFNYFKKTLGFLARERKKGNLPTTTQATQSRNASNAKSPYFNQSQLDQAILNTLR